MPLDLKDLRDKAQQTAENARRIVATSRVRREEVSEAVERRILREHSVALRRSGLS